MSSSGRRSSSSGSNRKPTRRTNATRTPAATNARGTRTQARKRQTSVPQPASRRRGSKDVARVGRLSVDGLGLKEHGSRPALPKPVKIAVGVVAGLAVLAIVFLVLSFTPVFVITNVVGEATDHVTSTDIVNLAAVEDGTTLLNVNTSQIEENLKKNPWVASVSVKREFPNTLSITITEQQAFAIVVAGSADKAWYISGDGSWIQPVAIQSSGDATLASLALDRANKEGLVLIQNVSGTLSPVAGEKTDNEAILAVIEYQDQFSEGLRDQIVSYSAASAEALSCTLKSGIEVSLGSPTNISLKESVITALMAEYPNQLTYINVRIPSKPTYRKIDSDSVTSGTGVQTDAIEDAAQDADNSTTTGDEQSDDSSSTDQDSSSVASADEVEPVTADEIENN